MPRKVEDVLRSRRSHREAAKGIMYCRDDLNRIRELLKVLAVACTSLDIPTEFHCNAALADLIDDELRATELRLAQVGKLIRGNL